MSVCWNGRQEALKTLSFTGLGSSPSADTIILIKKRVI